MTRIAIQKKSLISLIASVVFAFTAGGDTLILNSGVTHEGKLVSKTPDAILFEVGKSVKQVRTFKRSDIKSLIVIPPDEIAYESIKSLVPTADMLDASDYRSMIEGAPENFLTAFPTSKLRPAVEKIIATLEDERSKIVAGGVKLDGKWITVDQIAADPYNHEGRIALAQLKARIAENEFLGSLRAFDALEKDYADSRSYPGGVAAINEILPKHSARLAAQLATSTRDNKRRATDYGRMREDERAKAEAAYNRQLAPFLKSHAADMAAKKKWLDFHIWDLASITYAQEEAKNETQRLGKLDMAKLTTRAKSIEEATGLAAADQFLEATAVLKSIGKIEPGSRADELRSDIAEAVKVAEAETARAKSAAERDKRMKARETIAAAEVAKAKEENISKPIPQPGPGSEAEASLARNGPDESGGDGADSDIADSDGIHFDRTGGEFKKPTGGGFSLITVLLIVIPIMGIVTFLSIRAAKNNQVEDFILTETDDEDTQE